MSGVLLFLRWAAVFLAVLFVDVTSGAGEDEVAYFWVGHRSRVTNDGYVLPMRGATNISSARAQLELDVLERSRFVAARVTAGGDSINRNLAIAGQPRWSWHVTEFIGFFNGGIGFIGDPTLLEQDVELWLAEWNGQIVFPGYAVIRELTLEELFCVDRLDAGRRGTALVGSGIELRLHVGDCRA